MQNEAAVQLQTATEITLKTTAGDARPVYLVGSFNDWQVADERYRLQATADGTYTLTFEWPPGSPDTYEYKYVRGNWDGEELDYYGNPVPNRCLRRQDRHRPVDTVARWKRNGQGYCPDLLPRIEVLDEPFNIPQLICTRRITALLPHDYHTSGRRYPVLYLQDGQNLFDDYAPFGSWGVDKKLAILAEYGLGDLIVVAIDHAAEERVAEFTPSFRTRLGRGQGKQYVRFLAETLKPHVDARFRTLPEQEHTGIGGSSMGGLISIYAGLMYPHLYGKLMIFSPSLWVVPSVPFHLLQLSATYRGRIYLYAGGRESETMVPNLERFREQLQRQVGATEVAFKTSIDPGGQHNEARWGEEFPHAVRWLFFTT